MANKEKKREYRNTKNSISQEGLSFCERMFRQWDGSMEGQGGGGVIPPPQKKIKLPIWLSLPRGRWKFKVPQGPIKSPSHFPEGTASWWKFVHFTRNSFNDKGLQAVETTLKQKNLLAKIIISFVKIILTLNSFIFNCKNVLWITRCAMVTKCANICKYLYGYVWRNTHLSVNQTKAKLSLRYIDDISFTRTGSENEQQQFL